MLLTAPSKPAAIAATLAALLATAMPNTPTAHAAEAAYAGTWGVDADQCKLSQDAEGAPFVFAKDRYDQHEAHCTFKSVTPAGPVFKIAAECSVEGDTQSQDFTLSVSGNTLTMSDDAGALELTRCK